jgi:hypothetical protein
MTFFPFRPASEANPSKAFLQAAARQHASTISNDPTAAETSAGQSRCGRCCYPQDSRSGPTRYTIPSGAVDTDARDALRQLVPKLASVPLGLGAEVYRRNRPGQPCRMLENKSDGLTEE